MIRSRYQVGYDGDLLAEYSTFLAAKNRALQIYARSNGTRQVFIFDSMAHVGACDTWVVSGTDIVQYAIRKPQEVRM